MDEVRLIYKEAICFDCGQTIPAFSMALMMPRDHDGQRTVACLKCYEQTESGWEEFQREFLVNGQQ